MGAQCSFFPCFPFLPGPTPRAQLYAADTHLARAPGISGPDRQQKVTFTILLRVPALLFLIFQSGKFTRQQNPPLLFFPAKYDGIMWQSSQSKSFKAGWSLVGPWTGEEVWGRAGAARTGFCTIIVRPLVWTFAFTPGPQGVSLVGTSANEQTIAELSS